MAGEIRRVHFVGLGALGLLYGSRIAENLGTDDLAFVMDRGRYERHSKDTYKVNGVRVALPLLPCDEAKPCDLLIVAVKYPQLEQALETMASSVGEDTIILSVMNGVTSEEILGRRFGQEKLLHAIGLGMDAMNFRCELQYTQRGKIHMGVDSPQKQEMLEKVHRYFDRAGIEHQIEADIRHVMWKKFMMNVGINQACMVFNANYAQVTQPDSEARMVFVGAMREVIALAKLEGVTLQEQDMLDYFDLVATFSPQATPSMGQDRINRNPSEVEMFAGTVRELAKKHGLLVPTNDFIYRRVHEIEAEY